MTPNIPTLCPAPEGMEWHEDPEDAGAFVASSSVGRVFIKRVDDHPRPWLLIVRKGSDSITLYVTEKDLPSAYRRALVAVGLASPWTSEVPTVPGVYVVRSNSRQTGGEMFRLYDEDEHGDAGERPWVDAHGRHRTISQMSGCLFLPLPLPLSDVPCPQPPKET